ncbi:MAG: YebC/PmpR family DNA-binding transcriptional regulator, partial [Chloroflexota bacterium]
RGTGELEGGEMFEITYEAYGSDGVAFVIETLTDNKNRTIAAVKAALNKNNGTLASSGSVTFQFEQKGYIVIKGEADFDELFMVAAEAGAEDVVNEDDTLTVYTARDDYGTVEQALSEAGYETEESELRWFAQNELDLPKAKAVKNLKLQEALEDIDDVQSVSSNLAISDEVVAEFETA